VAETLLAELPLILGLLTTGMVAGFLAGLLGVGGGIVIVPVLFTVLGSLSVSSDVRMHIALGTSLATIVPTSIASLRTHHTKGAVDWQLFKSWLPGLAAGVVIGTWLAATQMSGMLLANVFAIVAILVALDLLLRDRSKVDAGTSNAEAYAWIYKPIALPSAGVVGSLSAMMGIGGGTLSVPFLNAIGFPMHRAVATSAGFGLVIAVPATLGYIAGGWNVSERPFASLGYVNLIGLGLITTASIFTAPLGSRVAHAMNAKTLRFLFSGFLVLTAIRMFGTV